MTFYRTFSSAGRTSRWGYGHVAKTESRYSYVDRVSRDLIVVYVNRGTGTFSDGNGERRRVAAGDALVHWPDTSCSLIVDTDGMWLERWITTDPSFASAMADLGVIRPDRTVLRVGLNRMILDGFDRLGRHLREMHDSDVDRLCVQAHDLLVEMNRLTRGRGVDDGEVALVQQACRRLADSIADADSLPNLAADLGIGYERFRKVFRRHVGIAPGEYRIRRRIDRARELIIQNRSSKEIAGILGYADQFVFSKQFKRLVGESPEAFRRRMS